MAERLDIEIVSHCWRYYRLLSYQLSGLILHPPQCRVRITVFCTEDPDDPWTLPRVDWYVNHPLRPANVTIVPALLPREKLWRRAIGRNLAAVNSTASIVFFSDCDQVLGSPTEPLLDSIIAWAGKQTAPHWLAFPHYVSKCSYNHGDELIQTATEPALLDINQAQFTIKHRNRAAIGGSQIVSGDLAREKGYARDSRRHQRKAGRWVRTRDDPVARRAWGVGPGIPLPFPGFYRIRHSQYGRIHVGVIN